MREKSVKLGEKYPSIVSLVMASVWLIVLLVLWEGLRRIPFIKSSDSGYLGQLIVDFIGTGVSILAIWLLKMGSIFKEKRYGLGKGFVIGLYFIVVGMFSLIVTTISTIAQGKNEMNPIWKILVFTITMFLIGAAEELMFRGVVANLLFVKFGKNRQGVWFSVLLTGIIFGAGHLFNAISPEVSFYSALIQGIVAGIMGMVFTAVYYRCRNIWVVIILHAFIDFAGLFTSGVFGTNTLDGTIGTYSAINLVATIPYFIVLLVLLRKKKVDEILEQSSNEEPNEGAKEETSVETNVETKRLVIALAGYFVVIVITFIAGVGTMVEMFQKQYNEQMQAAQSAQVESFSGTYIEQDLSETITLKEDGTYLTYMKADNVSKGTLIGMVFADEEEIYISNISDSCQVDEKLELKAGDYFCKMIMISSLEEYEDFKETYNFEVSKEEDTNFQKIIESGKEGQSSADFSFIMTLD